jgi:spermidine/putrescine transport system substrate-binding protein
MVAGGVAFMPSLLAACGGDDDGTTTGTGSDGTADLGGGGDPNKLVVSNWPAYIDPTEGGVTGSVDLFREETDIDLRYTEDYNDNNEFFAEIQPVLAAGDVLDQDIIVPSYWMASRLRTLEWLDPLPLDEVPNAANLEPDLRNPVWDPDGTFTLPWQGYITGIAYNVAATGRELRTMDDLLDPEFRGKIGFLLEMQDTIGLFLASTGKDPATATFDDATEAFDIVEQATNDGQVRRFTGNDYMDELVSGDFVACIGWSGDIAQLQADEPNLRFVVPESGGMTGNDTMVMPKGAPNRTAAAEFMNWVYDPVNAARIAAYIGYRSPVVGIREELAKNPDTAALADNPLMFPDEEMLSNLHVFNLELTEDELLEFDDRYAQITGA